jgi:hypothetical protein
MAMATELVLLWAVQLVLASAHLKGLELGLGWVFELATTSWGVGLVKVSGLQ